MNTEFKNKNTTLAFVLVREVIFFVPKEVKKLSVKLGKRTENDQKIIIIKKS